MDVNETSALIELMGDYAPFVGVAISGSIGTLVAIIGYFNIHKLRLHKIESAIGRRVLSGERRLATHNVMKDCETRIIELVKDQDERFQDHVRDEVLVFVRIEEKIGHTHERIDEILTLLAGKG